MNNCPPYRPPPSPHTRHSLSRFTPTHKHTSTALALRSLSRVLSPPLARQKAQLCVHVLPTRGAGVFAVRVSGGVGGGSEDDPERMFPAGGAGGVRAGEKERQEEREGERDETAARPPRGYLT